MMCNADDDTGNQLNLIATEKIIIQSKRDLEFVCKQILRFTRMKPTEIISHCKKNVSDAFCTIPHPENRGQLICGSLAWERFSKLAERTIAFEPSLAGRIGIEGVKKIVINVFVKRVLKERLEIDKDLVEIILQDVISQTKSSMQDMEHFFPCVLFHSGGPQKFIVGPVTFTRRTQFFLEKKLSLRRSMEENTSAHIEHVNKIIAQGFPRDRALTDEQSRNSVRGIQAQAVKTFRGYPWVAQVKIKQCDNDTSRELAIKAVETALNAIRVILGANHTDKLRLASSRGNALRTAAMWADSRDVIHVSVGKGSLSQVGSENWYEALIQQGNYLERLGSALEVLVEPHESSHLQTRFIDAINWFGDAATGIESTASLVKYTAAIERLLFGKFAEGHTKTFAARVKLIYVTFGCNTEECIYEKATSIYKMRSALLHGAHSPRDTQVRHMAKLAEEVSRLCILSAAQFYPMLMRAYNNPGPKELEDALSRVDKEGLEWLLELCECTF